MDKVFSGKFSSFWYWSSPLFLYLFWKIITYFPKFFYLVFIAAFIFLAIFLFKLKKEHSSKLFLFSFSSFFLLIASAYLFLSLLPPVLLSVFWIIIIWRLYHQLREFDKYLYKKEKENHLSVLTVNSMITVFFLSSSFFAMQSFLALSVWPLIIIFSLIIFLLINCLAFFYQWIRKDNYWLWLLFTLLITELALILSFLPLLYYILGVIMSILFYTAFNFFRFYFQKSLSKKKIRNYAYFIFISLSLILLSARWL